MMASPAFQPTPGTPVDRRLPVPFRAPSWLARIWRSNRRHAPRLADITGFAHVNGTAVTLGDISRGGMQLIGYRGLLDRQDRFDFRLSVACGRQGPGGEELTLDLAGEAIVAWRRGDRLGAAFYGLQPDDRAGLDRLLAVIGARLEA